jgi:transketolase
MSKGHASLALYAILYQVGYLTGEDLAHFCKPGSPLGGEPKLGDIPGIEATTGSLGHGLSFAAGIAMANRMDHLDSRVYAIIGDGECQEGSVWEAALSIGHHQLENLTVIIDDNRLQAMDTTEHILTIEPLRSKWESFGFEVLEMDGHNPEEIQQVMTYAKNSGSGNPRAVIAHTIKGKGISFMENVPIWHYRMPNPQELEIVLHDLDLTMEELTGGLL